MRLLPLQWRHNELYDVSNHQPLNFLHNRLFRSKKTSKLRITCLCAGNSPVSGEFPAQRASKAENVSIWWHHHECNQTTLNGLNKIDHYQVMRKHNKHEPSAHLHISHDDVIKWHFRVTGPLCGEFTGLWWIPITKASDAEFRCFLWSTPEEAVETMETLVVWDVIMLNMTSL